MKLVMLLAGRMLFGVIVLFWGVHMGKSFPERTLQLRGSRLIQSRMEIFQGQTGSLEKTLQLRATHGNKWKQRIIPCFRTMPPRECIKLIDCQILWRIPGLKLTRNGMSW